MLTLFPLIQVVPSPCSQFRIRNMQSLRQYRCLGRRLRQQYVNENTTYNTSTTLVTTQQDTGSSTPLENQSPEKKDLEKANDVGRPSVIVRAIAATQTPSRSSSVAPNGPLSSTGAPVDRTTTLTNRFSGVHVRDSLTPGNPESRVYVVGLGNDDANMNPRTWGVWLRVWAT